MGYVNFSELKEKVRIEKICDLYGLTMTRKGAQWRGKCPECNAGGDRALAVNTDKQSYFCFSAHKGGDLIALAAHVRGLSQRDAAEEISKRMNLDSSPTTPSPPTKAPEENLYLDALRDQLEELEQRVSALEENKVVKLRAT